MSVFYCKCASWWEIWKIQNKAKTTKTTKHTYHLLWIKTWGKFYTWKLMTANYDVNIFHWNLLTNVDILFSASKSILQRFLTSNKKNRGNFDVDSLLNRHRTSKSVENVRWKVQHSITFDVRCRFNIESNSHWERDY